MVCPEGASVCCVASIVFDCICAVVEIEWGLLHPNNHSLPSKLCDIFSPKRGGTNSSSVRYWIYCPG